MVKSRYKTVARVNKYKGVHGDNELLSIQPLEYEYQQ
jgi:hypothetical protein